MTLVDELDIDEAFTAADYLTQHFQRTPLIRLSDESTLLQALKSRSPDIAQHVDALLLKMDSLQEEGTFKSRGAEWFFYRLNKAGKLPTVAVTASAGNHAKGVALAAGRYGVPAVVFMPKGAPEIKVQKVRELGAEVFLTGDYYDDSVLAAKKHVAETSGALYVPAFEHKDVIYGQGSKAFEIFQKMGGVPIRDSGGLQDRSMADMPLPYLPDVIIEAVGGGGSITGDGIIVDHFEHLTGEKIYVVGVQAAASDSLAQSFRAKRLLQSTGDGNTIADGINVRSATEEMLRCVLKYVDDIVRVDEPTIRFAIREVFNDRQLLALQNNVKAKIGGGVSFKHGNMVDYLNIVEGAAAAPIAALASGAVNLEGYASAIGRKLNVVCVLTGSNIDRSRLEEIMRGA